MNVGLSDRQALSGNASSPPKSDLRLRRFFPGGNPHRSIRCLAIAASCDSLSDAITRGTRPGTQGHQTEQPNRQLSLSMFRQDLFADLNSAVPDRGRHGCAPILPILLNRLAAVARSVIQTLQKLIQVRRPFKQGSAITALGPAEAMRHHGTDHARSSVVFLDKALRTGRPLCHNLCAQITSKIAAT